MGEFGKEREGAGENRGGVKYIFDLNLALQIVFR